MRLATPGKEGAGGQSEIGAGGGAPNSGATVRAGATSDRRHPRPDKITAGGTLPAHLMRRQIGA